MISSETTGQKNESRNRPVRYKSNRHYFSAADPFSQMDVSVIPLPTPEQQLADLQSLARSGQEILVPPGLTVRSPRSLDALKQVPHIGAMWNAVSHKTKLSVRNPNSVRPSIAPEEVR